MKFVCSIYILIVVFTENKDKFLVRCITNLKENELVHLSQKLNALECLKLAQAVYELTPFRTERRARRHGIPNEILNSMSTTSKDCLINLEQWNNDFPINMKPSGRATMEMTLRWLGRPDLAKYVREHNSLIKFPDTKDYDVANMLESPEHAVSRRHTSDKNKHSHSNEKKKKKKKRGHLGEPNKGRNKVQKAVAAVSTHAAVHKNHHVKKKDNKHPNKKSTVGNRSICCSILFVLFFISVCLALVYFFYKRNRPKARGTRFKYNWSSDKEDKDTFTDNLEWDQETVCGCSDVEGGCTGKCKMCREQKHQTASDNTAKMSRYMRKLKKQKDRTKQRLSFLQKNFYNRKKQKDQENRNRKCVRRRNPGTIEFKGKRDASRDRLC